MKKHLKALNVLLGVMVVVGSARADFIYNNLGNNSTTNALPLNNNLQFGQQVFMDSAALAAAPYLTNFAFEYSIGTMTALTPQIEVQFYNNTGSLINGYASPAATPFYQTGFFSIATGSGLYLQSLIQANLYPGGGADIPLSGPMPSNFTVIFTVSGLNSGDQVGLPVIYNNSPGPITGTNYADYWQNNGSGWQLVTNSVVTGGLAMQFQATPEPSVLALGALGALLLGRVVRRRQ